MYSGIVKVGLPRFRSVASLFERTSDYSRCAVEETLNRAGQVICIISMRRDFAANEASHHDNTCARKDPCVLPRLVLSVKYITLIRRESMINSRVGQD
jgi:hypothetical protein